MTALASAWPPSRSPPRGHDQVLTPTRLFWAIFSAFSPPLRLLLAFGGGVRQFQAVTIGRSRSEKKRVWVGRCTRVHGANMRAHGDR